MNKIKMLILLSILIQLSNKVIANNYEYSINLMWINNKFNPDNVWVYPAWNKRPDILFQVNLLKWIENNPKAAINFWFDSVFVNEAQIKSTQTVFDFLNNTYKRRQNNKISLKDIRDLKIIKKNAELFSSPTIPAYFKIDILKFIISLQTLKDCQIEKKCVFVFADLSVTPIKEEELFDKKTLDNLKNYGLIMKAGGKVNGMENSFHILGTEKPTMLKAIREAIINVNLSRMNYILEGNKLSPNTDEESHAIQLRTSYPQIIYESIPTAFMYFEHLENKAKLSINNELLDSNNDNTEKFGPHNAAFPSNYSFKNDWGSVSLSDIYIPTKWVDVPEPSNDYN